MMELRVDVVVVLSNDGGIERIVALVSILVAPVKLADEKGP